MAAIGGAMSGVLASNAVDRVFESRLCQTIDRVFESRLCQSKDCKIGIC